MIRKIAHTFATQLFVQGGSIVAGIATAHAFGPAGKGILSLAMILLTFGVTTADGVRDAIAYQIGREKLDARDVWATALRLLGLIAPAGIIVFLVLWHSSNGMLAYLFAAIVFPFALTVQTTSVLYQLRDRIKTFNVQNSVTIGGLSIVTFLIVTFAHASVPVVLAVSVLAYAIAAVWALSGVPGLIGGRPNFSARGLLREQIVFGSKVALSSNVTLLALRVDVFVVGALLQPALLGIYTMALATGELLYNVSRSVLWTAAGPMATLDYGDAAALCARLVRSLVALQFLAAVALFIVGPWLITFVYGARFAESGNVLRFFLPGVIFYSGDGLLSYFISVKSARPGVLLAMETATLVLTFLITYFAIAKIGIYAGAIAHTVAFLVSYTVKTVIFIRLTGIEPRDIFFPKRSDLDGLSTLWRRAIPAA